VSTRGNTPDQGAAIEGRIRAPAAGPGSFGRSAAYTLPADLKLAGVRRIGLMYFAIAVANALYLLVMGLVVPRDSYLWVALVPRYASILALGAAIAGVMFALAHWRRLSADTILRIGSVALVLVCFDLALFRHSHEWATGEAFRQWSPVAVVILLNGIIVPGLPRRVLIVSLVAAATDPLALAIAVSTGHIPQPPPHDMIMLALTPLFAALMAYAGSRVMYGMVSTVGRGQRLGSYRLVEKLGRGGMGEVWRANHPMLGREAAVKLIRAEPLAIPERELQHLLQRFEREVRATAALRSPNTVRVYDYGATDDGTFYYAMELLDGLDLEELVVREGPLPAERVIFVLRQVCRSLAEAHRQGLIHRDVKPANIYLCRKGIDVDVVKVLDFGLVKRAVGVDASGGSLTELGMFTGTPAYASPEMAAGDEPVTPLSDVYALGCVAFWLLTGRTVFHATSPVNMLLKHISQRPKPPSEHTELAIPPDLDRLVLDCLRKRPAERPASIDVVERRLAAVALERPWTPERAEEWWNVHRPGA